MKASEIEAPADASPSTAIPILLLEPNPADAAMILRELRRAGLFVEPTVVASRREFEAALRAREFAAVLVDDSLPDWTGLEALQCLRDQGKGEAFLLITGSLREGAPVEFANEGFNGFVERKCLARLPVALQRVISGKQLREANIRTQSALAESEARRNELVERSIYGIFRVTPDGVFLSANPTLLQLLACASLDGLKSLNLATDVFRYPEQYGQLLASCREGGLVHSAESEWRRKDGGFVAVRLHLQYLSLPGGGEALQGSVEDITELRALEHQLQQTQKFELIGELAGGIAHDFNNIVGAILGWAEIGYEQSRTYPVIAERFARIREQAERAAALIRDLLSFARRQPLQPQALDLNALTKNLTSFLDKVISRDIEINVVARPLQPVKADPAQIEQVVMNLCLNARDAMPEGGHLTIETEMVHLDDSYRRIYPYVIAGSYAVLSVADTGFGMDSQTRERIFEPFFFTKERGKGSGMGLATAFGIVKQHGGFMHIYSEPGQGSLFRVYLPLMNNVLCEKTSPALPATGLSDLRGTETILLAEDSDAIREIARQFLVNLGYRVLVAEDGEHALRLCEKETPALAVLDVVMPRLGGPDVAAKLRQRFPQLPVLFTSGYPEKTAFPVAHIPASSFLQKPYSPISLSRAIREILGS